jgi:glyoxylase-like metal-dependent hydrolase (beta-lactamase superfamily II)
VGETITLIETGVAGCETRIFEYIRSVGRDPSEISLVIRTHSHLDHIGAARVIREATGCSVAAHPVERAWIEDVECQNRERPVPGFATLVGGSVPIDFELDGGVTIDIDGSGEYELEVLHTPGHSAGSIAMLLSGEGAHFSGDVIPVSGDLPVYDDVTESILSIRLLRSVRGIRVLLAAWDEPRVGEDAYGQMDRALAYLKRIRETVVACSGDGNPDPMELTKNAAAALGLPPQAVSPLLARTFAANLRARNDDLQTGSHQ